MNHDDLPTVALPPGVLSKNGKALIEEHANVIEHPWLPPGKAYRFAPFNEIFPEQMLSPEGWLP